MQKIKIALLCLSCLLLSSCSVMAVKKYNPNFKTTRKVENSIAPVGDIVVKGTATTEDSLNSNSMSCRLATFEMPANSTLRGYIKSAVADELDAAKKLSDSGEKLQIVVNEFVSDTAGFDTGVWTIDMNYQLGKKLVNVKTETRFTSAFFAQTACTNTATALEDALRENFEEFFKKIRN